MKQERFTAVWGWLAIAQIVLCIVAFPHILSHYRPLTPEALGETIGNDIFSIVCWVGIHWLYEQKGKPKNLALKLLLWVVFILCLYGVSAVLLVNIRALFA